MYRSFSEIKQDLIQRGIKKTIALAASHDADALESVVAARRCGVADACLIGDEERTRSLLKQLDETPLDYTFINEMSDADAARQACLMVTRGEADIPMKGGLQTADFMRAVLGKEFGFIKEKNILCQATVFEYPAEERLMIISDCAVNIAPDYQAKGKILSNAVTLAHQLGIACPKVAVIAPVETVNPAIQSTIDAAMLSKAAQRGQFKGCIVDGPLALDNAVSDQAAKSKGIVSDVAGIADILIMPDLCTGNALTKSLHYFAHVRQTGSLTGSSVPIVMTSRTDTAEDKFFSILIAILQSIAQ